MVPERGGRIVEPVHRGDHGMDRVRVSDDRLGGEVAERRALENVAVVEQQAVGTFVARLSDQRRRTREADRIIGTIPIIVVRIEIGVEIGEAKQAQAKSGFGARGLGSMSCPRGR